MKNRYYLKYDKIGLHISASQVQMYRPSLISSFKNFKVSLFIVVLIRVFFYCCTWTRFKLRLHEEAVMKMLQFACTMRMGKGQICEAIKYYEDCDKRVIAQLKFSAFLVSWNAFHSSHVKSGGFHLFSGEDNVTSVVLTSSIFMNQETPDERRGD